MSQIEKLQMAGYPETEIVTACHNLIKWVKGVNKAKKTTEQLRKENRLVVVPYVLSASNETRTPASLRSGIVRAV